VGRTQLSQKLRRLTYTAFVKIKFCQNFKRSCSITDSIIRCTCYSPWKRRQYCFQHHQNFVNTLTH